MAGRGKPKLSHDNLDSLNDKIENNGATKQGKLSAKEFNDFVDSVINEQENTDTVVDNAVFGIKRGTTTYYPDDNGVVELVSENAGVTVYMYDNQTSITSFDNTVVLKVGAIVANQSGSIYAEQVALRLYKMQNNLPVLVYSTTMQSSSSTASITYNDINVTDYIDANITQYRIECESSTIPGLISDQIPLTIRKINSYIRDNKAYSNNYLVPFTVTTNTFDIDVQVYGTIPNSDNVDDYHNRKLKVKIYKNGDIETETNPLIEDLDYILYTFSDVPIGNYLSTITLSGNEKLIVYTQVNSQPVNKVHAVEMWLEYDNGTLEYESTHIISRYFMYNQAAAVTDNVPKIVLQDIHEQIDNYIQSDITKYTVYLFNEDGSIDNTSLTLVTFKLQDGSNTYLQLALTVQSGNTYTLSSAIEIESTGSDEPDQYQVSLYAYYDDDGTDVDLISSSGISNPVIIVNNQYKFSPTSGATFILNPKVRSNQLENWKSIINDATGNAITSVWSDSFNGGTQDGWVLGLYQDEDGNSYSTTVLRIPAGRSIQFTGLTPFYPLRSQNTSTKAVTIEFDMIVSDVVSPEETPLISIGNLFGEIGNQFFKGFQMNSLNGTFVHGTSFSDDDTKNSIFAWQEGVRTHFSINILPDVDPKNTDNRISLIRIFINGKIIREIVYDKTNIDSEFDPTAILKIGSEYASIDLFSIRVYENKILLPSDILRNYIATMPTTDLKLNLRLRNDITNDDGTINISKVTQTGDIKYNTLVWIGDDEPRNSRMDEGKNKSYGYWEIYQYVNNELDLNHSGTIGKAAYEAYVANGKQVIGNEQQGYTLLPMSAKRQGTTANTYAYSNLQTKIGDIVYGVLVKLNNINSEYITYEIITETVEGQEVAKAVLTGGNLDGNKYVITVDGDGDNCIVVPDGWFTFDNKYCGVGFQVISNSPMALKLVNKINYASSMQSHLMGGVMSYNDLHNAIVGYNALQERTSTKYKARVAKCVQLFMFFSKVGNDTVAQYRGLCTFGSGKMDKPTWGMKKSDKNAGFCMIEGASNNNPITDMRVPFFDNDVYYDEDEEAFCYDYGGMEKIANLDVDEGNDTIIKPIIKRTWNWLYLHNPRMLPFDGDYQYFNKIVQAYINRYTNITSFYATVDRTDMVQGMYVYFSNSDIEHGIPTTGTYVLTTKGEDQSEDVWTSDITLDQTYQYWIFGGTTNKFHLYRFDYKTDSWVLAGIDQSNDTIVARNLQTELSSYIANWTQDKDTMNKNIIDAIASDARAHIGEYINETSLLFHYAYVNYLIAGTDNCSKNTYYVYIPDTELFELHQDDLDTIFMTDNSAWMTKPYYVDRKRPYPEGSTESTYEGKANVLFNLCEAMWGAEGEDAKDIAKGRIARMLNTVFGTMYSNAGSVMGFFNKYYFNVQKYFPEIAWNEQARVRYEYPEARGFDSDTRHVHPITQSLGDQLLSEMQYMKRRLIMSSGYAFYGYTTSGLDLGISDLKVELGGTINTAYNTSLTFSLKPHQYIYPVYYLQDGRQPTYTRLSPLDENPYLLEINATSASGDAGAGLCAANYYVEIGNIGINPWTVNPLEVNGKRLKKLEINPLSSSSGLHSAQLSFGTSYPKSATEISFKDMTNSSIQNNDLTMFKRATRIDLRNTPMQSVLLPVDGVMEEVDERGSNIETVSIENSKTLETIRVSYKCKTLNLKNCPNLTTIEIEDGVNASLLESITLDNLPKITTIATVQSLKQIVVKNCELFTGFSNNTTTGIFQNIQVIDMKTGNSSSLGSYGIINGIIRDQLNLETMNLTTIKFSNISWGTLESGGFSGTDLDMILRLDKDNIDLTGIIYMNSGNGVMNFARKKLVLDKIDNFIEYNQYNSTTALTNLAIKYTVITLTSASVSGSVYTRQLGDYQYNVNPDPLGANNFRSITWSIDTVEPDPALVTVSIDSDTGLLELTEGQLTTQAWTYVRCSIVTFNSTSFVNDNEPLVASKKVYLYNRPAEVGDFVYADGEYSNEFDQSKTLIGVCVFVGDKDNGDFYDETYALQNNVKVQDRLCVCCNNILISGSDTYNNESRSYSSQTVPFGLYRTTSNTVPSTTEVVKILTSTSGTPYLLDSDSTYNCYDSPISNISYTYGTTGGFTMTTTWLLNSFRDGTNAGTLDGYTKFPTDRALGSGFACDTTDLNSRLVPPMNSSNSLRYVLPTDENGNPLYNEGDLLNKGFMNTLQWIAHRNKLLTDNTFAGTEQNPTFRTAIPQDKFNESNELIKTEMQDLGGKLATIPYIANDLRIEPNSTLGTITDYDNKYRLLYYPAASACYAYEPTVEHDNEVLNQKFKKHNWFLPTLGLLARMYYLYKYALPGKSKTIFANAYDECVVNGNHKFSNFSTSSYYWSSTEFSMHGCWFVSFSNGYAYYNVKCSTGYVRALVAF